MAIRTQSKLPSTIKIFVEKLDLIKKSSDWKILIKFSIFSSRYYVQNKSCKDCKGSRKAKGQQVDWHERIFKKQTNLHN